MAKLVGNYLIEEFLQSWGIDIKNTVNVTIFIRLNDAVRVDVERFVDIPDEEQLKTEITKYYLTKIE